MKVIYWNKNAREFVRGLNQDTKLEIGALLMILQQGVTLGMPQSKPMKSIHTKAHELRVKDQAGAHRVIYALTLDDRILIPHAFTKKTQKTPRKEIELSIKRLKEIIHEDK